METAIFADELHTPPSLKIGMATDLPALVRYLAALKSVSITPDQVSGAVTWAEQALTSMRGDHPHIEIPRVADPATYVVNRIVDIIAAMEVTQHVLTLIEGKPTVTAEMLLARAQVDVDRFTGGVLFFKWPQAMEAFLSHYRDVPWAPIVSKGDDGSVLTIYKRNNVLHRDPEDGPAAHRTSALGACSEYWVDGKLHRPHQAGPAVINTEFAISGVLRLQYYKHGQLHRPAAEGPALLQTHDGRAVAETYAESGKLHRDPMLGPAQRIEADNFAQWVYALEGNFHRDHRQGPAVVATNFEDRGVRREEYCWEGKRHRPASEGPAVIETDASGNVVLQIYVEHGWRHRDPGEGAAWHGFEDGLEFWEYNAQDKLHREDGPAIIGRDPVTGVIACEKYSRHGEPHRRHGPALITRDRETGVLLGEEYYSFGQLHRDAGPAYVGYNLESGKVTYEEYCRDGQTHRDDGPAVIIRYPDGSPHIERWYRGNDCHRDPKDGPAHCERDAQGRVITEEYWEHGVVAEPPSVAATTPNRRARRAKATAGGRSHAKSRENSHA